MATGGVEFADVSFTAGGRLLLRGVSFRCEPGTTTALLGRSGSGKTTLLRTVNALVRPTGGKVLVGGADVGSADVLALRRGIGYVIQESGLFPHMTVQRNVLMPLEVAGGRDRGEEVRQRAAQAVRRVGLDEDVLPRYPWQLSGGQRQRVGVARALISEPKVLLMDEPFGALDPLTRAEMQGMMRELLRPGEVTTLIVTHDLQEALFLADRVVLMQEGQVLANVRSDEVMASENPAVQAYVRATQPRDEAA
jgi:osmoprotectant transport system ATP-binding protein